MSLNPEAAIKSEFIERYENEVNAIWDQVVRLNTNLYLLEKIRAFPFDEEVAIEPTFWEYTYQALFDSSILLSWKLVSDKTGGFTITQFKNLISTTYIKHEKKAEFKDLIKKIDFSKKLKTEKKKVEVLRQKQVAHLDLNSRDQVEAVRLEVAELKKLADSITELFTNLSFSEKACLPIGYHLKVLLQGQDPEKTDIDKILDFMRSL
ncbi:MAG TPA: hypothetical protein DCZ75_11290 [Geobacter sp.]|nr:hypothetical protein [Geobacter sp.]